MQQATFGFRRQDVVENGDGADELELVADDDDSQWVQPDFSWKGQVQFYPDGTPWKRNGPQHLFDHKAKGGFFEGWPYPTDGIMPDTGSYNFAKEDRNTPWYMKIYLVNTTHPGLMFFGLQFILPTFLLQLWGWWNYPRSHKELEERM